MSKAKPEPQLIADLGLPHRAPFLFVREIIARDPGTSAECATVFDREDPIFTGHFPGHPLVPGVILTEALAQTAGIAAAPDKAQDSKPRFLLSGIRSMKFFQAVRPDEQIILRATKLAQVGDLWQFEVEARVKDKVVAAGQLVLNAVN